MSSIVSDHRADVDRDALTSDGVDLRVDGNRISLDWAFWRPQLEAMQAAESGDYDIVAFIGGFRSGKSVTGARYSIEVALTPDYAPARVLCMGKTYAEAKKTTYSVLFEQLPGDNLDPFLGDGDPENSPIVSNFSKQDGVITLINGSVLILASADKPNRYDGGKFSMAWFDEACHYNARLPGIMSTIASRMDYRPAGPKVQMWTSTGNGHNEAYDILERRQHPRSGDPIGERIYMTIANSLENPFLDEDDRARLLRTHGGTSSADQSLRGAFSKPEGMVYSQFRRHTHVVDHADARAAVGDWRIYGYDAGWSDPRAVIEIGRNDVGQLIAVDEFYQSETQVEDVVGDPNRAEAEQEYWAQGKKKGAVFCEHVPADIAKWRKRGWRAGKADKSIDPGIDHVRRRFRTDVDDRAGLLISERCENLLNELLSYTEDDVGGTDVDDHLLDSLRYALFTNYKKSSSSSSSSTAVDKA